MSERTVSDAIVDRIAAWGVDRVFGYSGDGINGVMEALRIAEGGPRFIQARHEENAALMAVGHAKFSGTVGVTMSTQGPGAVHLLNGLYDAKLDGVPVVAIVGQQRTSVLGSGYMQEISLQNLFADVAAEFVQQVASPDQVPMVIDRAFRTALARRCPTVVIVPHDVQTAPAGDVPHEHGMLPTAAKFARPLVMPTPADLQRAVDVLTSGSRVALLVGQGAAHARDEVVAIAQQLNAGITTSLLGKPYVDERLPFAAGTMGHLGTTASAHVLGACDTLLIVGSNDPWTEFYPAPGQARAVQIDIDAQRIGNRYPIEIGLVGDAALTLDALAAMLPSPRDTGWRAEVESAVERWHRIASERAAVPAVPINPEAAIRALDDRIPADAMIALDVGSIVYWYARQLHLPVGATAHVSGTLASMGCGVPYGIAAKLLHPERPVLVLAGDGGMQMTGVAELVTLSRLWRQWPDPRFVICVINNGDLAEVSWEQREMEGAPRFEESQALPTFPYAGYGQLLGLHGERVDDPRAIDGAWERALAADRPSVLEFVCDPSVPLLPPFPAGEAKLDTMRNSIAREDGAQHTQALLDAYARAEQR